MINKLYTERETLSLRIYNLNSELVMLDYYILVLCFLLTTGPLGVIVNCLFIYITVRHKNDLHKGYTWFLCAIMGINGIYSANDFLLQTIILVFDIQTTSPLCVTAGLLITVNGIAGVCMQPLLALNRYCSLFHAHLVQKIFTTRKNILMLICVYIFSFAMALTLMALGDITRIGNTICGPPIEAMPLHHICLFAAPMFGSYGICIFCGYKIFRLVQNHQKSSKELGSKLQDAKEIVRLIILELSVPVIIETPILVLSLVNGFAHLNIPYMIVSVCLCLFIIHPVLDAIIVCMVMKPYRIFLKRVWSKWRGKNNIQPTPSGRIIMVSSNCPNRVCDSGVSRETASSRF